MNVDLSLKKDNLPRVLRTRLAQTRVLKQYKVKNTKYTVYIKCINARRRTGNSESVLLTKNDYFTDCSKNPLNKNPHHRETSQPINIVNHLTSFEVMRTTTEGIYVGNRTN